MLTSHTEREPKPSPAHNDKMKANTIALSNIIDSWNMIDKFNLDWSKDEDHDTILISDEDFNMMLASVKNPRYIQNLKASHGRLVSHNY